MKNSNEAGVATPAWVAEQLAAGALSYLGGEILKNALGGVSTADLINKAVEELKRFFQEALDRETILVAQAHVDNAFALLLKAEATTNMDQKRSFITNADVSAGLAFYTLKRKGELALTPLVDAATCRVYISAAYRKHLAEDELARQSASLAVHQDAYPIIVPMVQTISKRLYAKPNNVDEPSVIGYDKSWWWILVDNGTKVTSASSYLSSDQAMVEGFKEFARRVSTHKKVSQDYERNVANVFWKTRDKWEAMLSELFPLMKF